METSQQLSYAMRMPVHTAAGDSPCGSGRDVALIGCDPRFVAHASRPLAHRPEAVGFARRIARSVLHAWRIDDDAAHSVLLVVSELVTNAVEHAQPPLALHLCRENRGRRVWVGITDGGPSARGGSWTSTCAHDEHGRGLAIVEALAAAHGADRHVGGTTHWARLPVACGTH
ncbi:ATP-binding protein [Streptomyces lydicus]|uniref:ATP-binding protein n=1 Tax=Streptomyces lydicus TaxID=47763 RepID=UPI001F50EDF6|nr:ATP-binding protein [Streptomyces lydicus]MCZ1005945.1 ATP-binding protein [Streptomyces lydicus]